MNLLWRITCFFARALSPNEAESVLGDLLESNLPAHRTLFEILGLVLRRQATELLTPSTIALLIGIVLPLSLLLTSLSRTTADHTAIYLWLFANSLDPFLLGNAGFWHGVASTAPSLAIAVGTLVVCSWSAATLIRFLSRHQASPLPAVFYLTLLLSACFDPSHALLATRGRDFVGNAAVFHSAFYKLFFPFCVQVLFVIVPATVAFRSRAFSRTAHSSERSQEPL